MLGFEVCEAEKIRCEGGAIAHLVSQCQSDIRLALNTLQFVATAAKAAGSRVTISEINKVRAEYFRETRERFSEEEMFFSFAQSYRPCRGSYRS